MKWRGRQMSDRDGVESRMDGYFDMIVTMARHGALAGKTGSWSDVAAKADNASRRWRTTQACHPALHAHFQEFQLWNEIFGAYVRPDRHAMLAATIHRIGNEEARDDLADVEVLLGVVCPEDHGPTRTRARHKPSLEEFAVIRQLRDAERRGTVSALDAALRSTVRLADRIGKDQYAGHPKCEPWPVFTVRRVLTRSLWEAMPHAHRTLLARLAQLEYFGRHAPDERKPQFFDKTPELQLPNDADSRWPFIPAWQFVPNVQRDEDPLDLGPERWLIEETEIAVRRGIEGDVKEQQEIDRKLALLATGNGIG
jgi:hypothetical protein